MPHPSRRVPFSFELYPARTADGMPSVLATASGLARVGPQFISVTFGAGGSDRGRSFALLRHLHERTAATAVAHITCVGATERAVRERIAAFLDIGVRSFLALRGDPPDDTEAAAVEAEVGEAAHLVRLIRAVHDERGATDSVTVAVAAFPNGHPRSRDRDRDIRVLLDKQAAGADFALTQLFFRADDYLSYVARARAAGVVIPIIPGVMPVTTLSRLHRVVQLSGESLPQELASTLARGGEDAAQAGLDFAGRLVAEVVDGGAPAVHLYAFNRQDAVLATLDRAGIPSSNTVSRDQVAASEGTRMTALPAGTILGYPRIGRRRELKRAVEAYWSGGIDRADLERTAAEQRSAVRTRLADLGLGRDDSSIPESFSYYDQVLDAALTVGALPARFADLRNPDGTVSLDALFTAARGDRDRPPLELTKWFDTNYHYLVPEIGPETAFTLSSTRLVDQVVEARAEGFVTRPVVVGPVTLLALSKATDDAPRGYRPLDRLDDLLSVYAELLGAFRGAGAEWVQLDEPALVSESLPDTAEELADAAARAYDVLGALAQRPQLLVAAGYAQLSAEAWRALAASPVEAIAVDLCRGAVPAPVDGLAGKTLVGGVIDGRNIWRGNLAGAWDRLEALRALGATVSAGTSTSLQHVPHDVADEPDLDARLKSWLAFADQKVEQVAILAEGLTAGRPAIADRLDEASAALSDRLGAPGVRDDRVRARQAALTTEAFARVDVAARREAQTAIALPVLPTTTIGSFPQTGDVRRARAAHDRGELSTADYEQLLRDEIAAVVHLQEEIGLDVLVHGEAERNDMVQYFAEHLDGFAVTRNGWVQSYGSRATRPSILWGDVSRPAPITVGWSSYAQSLTERPVKGMLTGPVTILAWSFVRDDQPLAETADQVALALRDEIGDLEAAGLRVVQVDEPALRELLPLKAIQQADYLAWSVGAFRLATGGAAAGTQVHTHLCYSEFAEVIDAIRALDADVTSIEAARSRGEVIDDIAASAFGNAVGPGVYDIHSPRVPTVDELAGLIERAVDALPLERVWVNPDCGLKTRAYPETVASLRNLVEATGRVREHLGVAV